MMNREQIEACRRIGRDKVNNRKTIGLPEIDALCDQALLATRGLQFVFLDKSLETSKLLVIVDGEPVGGLVALGLVANSQHRFAELRVVFPNLNDVNNPDKESDHE